MSYHWKQVQSGIHLPLEKRPGVAWSRDFRDVRTAVKNQPFGGLWILVRNRDGSVADSETLADFCMDLQMQSDGHRCEPTVKTIEWIS